MYRVAAVLIVLLVSAAPVRAAPSHLTEFSSLEAVQKWMYGYRARPEPGRVPDAFRVLTHLGTLKDPETSGIYVGFLAGALGACLAAGLVANLFVVFTAPTALYFYLTVAMLVALGKEAPVATRQVNAYFSVGSAVLAIDGLKGLGARRIRLLSIVAAPEGVAHLEALEPEATIYAAAVDRALNDRKFIVPGLGDFGDRLFGT